MKCEITNMGMRLYVLMLLKAKEKERESVCVQRERKKECVKERRVGEADSVSGECKAPLRLGASELRTLSVQWA